MSTLANLRRMTTATTGTGTITLGSAVSGFLAFGSGLDGKTVSYGIKDGTNSEVGRGLYTHSGTTLTRTVLASTNSDAAINLSGAAEVFITAVAEDFGGPSGPIREVLRANRTYYVRTDGSDSNNGLANTSGGAFLTLQKAWDTIVTLDLSGFSVTIQLGSGTFTGGLSVQVPPVGGNVSIVGAGSGSTTISGIIYVNAVARVTVSAFKITSVSNTCLFAAVAGSQIFVGSDIEFGAADYHLRADFGGFINLSNNTTISSSAYVSMSAQNCGVISANSITITYSGTPAWTFAGLVASSVGVIQLYLVTLSGAATGPRYKVTGNGVINSFGAGTASTYFAGNSNGTTATGGQQL